MRRWLMLLMCLISAAATAQAPALPPAIAQALRPPLNRPVYVDFWASWCVPCAQSFPWLNSVQARFGHELHVVAVNVDERRPDAERFLKRHPAEFTIVYDPQGALAAHYRLQGMPSAVLLGSDGEVLWQHSGFRENEIPQYEEAIRRALK